MLDAGKIYNPGDRNGRTVQAQEIELMWDGNMIGALVGPDPVEGVPAYAETVHGALQELADNLVRESVRVEIPHRRFAFSEIRLAENTTLQSNSVELCYLNETQACAVIRSTESNLGIWGIGNSVHQAISGLAIQLAENFVWVEVTAKAIWQFTDVDSLLKGDLPEDDES